MREIFINPATGEPWLEGEVYTRPDLADTLDLLAAAGERGEENLGSRATIHYWSFTLNDIYCLPSSPPSWTFQTIYEAKQI